MTEAQTTTSTAVPAGGLLTDALKAQRFEGQKEGCVLTAIILIVAYLLTHRGKS